MSQVKNNLELSIEGRRYNSVKVVRLVTQPQLIHVIVACNRPGDSLEEDGEEEDDNGDGIRCFLMIGEASKLRVKA